MMSEAAHGVNVELTVLATALSDSAAAIADHVIIGAPNDEAALRELSRRTEVITFDHELIDLELLVRLEEEGVDFRPSPAALRYSVDKSVQREEFATAGWPLPPFAILRDERDLTVLSGWSTAHDSAPVLKPARGGYDGRGVFFPAGDDEAVSLARTFLANGPVVVEERVIMRSEVAQMIVRSLSGDVVIYPLVTTVQARGMCVEVRMPADVGPSLHWRAGELSAQIAAHIGLVGVMAVEFFDSPRGLLINELALRPHNSGHWSIEGATTSQFANHLRAVTGQPLGPSEPTSPAAVMINVVGATEPGSLDAARGVEGVHVHDYAKTWRRGRKLGHVTAVGDDLEALHVRAWQSARAYGTDFQET